MLRIVLLLALSWGCGGGDGGGGDGGDAGPDAGGSDAGAMDAGGVPDDGSTAADSGRAFDAGSVLDAGAFDAGAVDAGPVDAGDLDAGPPDAGTGGTTIAFTAPPAAVTHVRGSVMLQLVVSGTPPDSVELWHDGALFVVLAPPYTYVWDTTFEPERAHVFEARAVRGGTVVGSATRPFTVDRTAPTVVATTPADGAGQTELSEPVLIDFSEAIAAGL